MIQGSVHITVPVVQKTKQKEAAQCVALASVEKNLEKLQPEGDELDSLSM